MARVDDGDPAARQALDGLEIRYAESPPRDVDALLLNPWPESLFAFAPTWDRLAEHAHLVAIDLPGFGAEAGLDRGAHG